MGILMSYDDYDDRERFRDEARQDAANGVRRYHDACGAQAVAEQARLDLKSLLADFEKSEGGAESFKFATAIMQKLRDTAAELSKLGYDSDDGLPSAKDTFSDALSDILGDFLGAAEHDIENDIEENSHLIKD